MKVLHVVQGYFPAIGGTERLIQLVSERLVKNHGDEVTVFTTPAYNCELFWRRDQPSLPVGVEEINGVTVKRFPVFNRLNRLRGFLSDITTRYKLPYNDRFRTLLGGPLVPGMTKAIADFGADVVAIGPGLDPRGLDSGRRRSSWGLRGSDDPTCEPRSRCSSPAAPLAAATLRTPASRTNRASARTPAASVSAPCSSFRAGRVPAEA